MYKRQRPQPRDIDTGVNNNASEPDGVDNMMEGMKALGINVGSNSEEHADCAPVEPPQMTVNVPRSQSHINCDFNLRNELLHNDKSNIANTADGVEEAELQVV